MVGYRITYSNGVFPHVIDVTPPPKFRSYTSTNGTTFSSLTANGLFANLAARAIISGPIPGNGGQATHTQNAGNFCGLPAAAQAVVGNVSVVDSAGAGFLTLFPGNLTTVPLVATSNYPAPATFGYNRHYFVGLSPVDGTFKVLTQFTTHLVLDASGYFAP